MSVQRAEEAGVIKKEVVVDELLGCRGMGRRVKDGKHVL